METKNLKPAMAAEKVETNLSPAVVENRNLPLRPEHNLHAAGMLLAPVAEAEFMRLRWPHRVNNQLSVEDNHRAIGRRRSAARILAVSPET